jgi:[acyl-carrier-protein] S-malonyltransferase
MAPAADGVARFLAAIRVERPATPVCTSVEGRLVAGGEDIRALLTRQVTAPVRWQATMAVLSAAPARLAVEFGSGRTLSGLWKRAVPSLPAVPVGDTTGIEQVREALA